MFLLLGRLFLLSLYSFPGGSVVKNLAAKEDTQVPSLGQKCPLVKEMGIHYSILAWETPWTEEPGGLHGITKSRIQYFSSTTEIQIIIIVY